MQYTGSIDKLEASYGFIMRDKYQDRIFMHKLYAERDVWQRLEHQKRVKFNLEFNYRGPFAVNVSIEQ